MARSRPAQSVRVEVLIASRRRCALCFGLNGDLEIKQGQIAHLDRDRNNNHPENLCFLCLPHHDTYDSRPSQSARFTPEEAKRYREELYETLSRGREEVYRRMTELRHEHGAAPTFNLQLSELAARLGGYLAQQSANGYKFDPQVSLATLPETLGCSPGEAEEVVDELGEARLAETNNEIPPSVVFPTDRLFWHLDPLFGDNDPVADSKLLARVLVEAGEMEMEAMGARLGWPPRRLNPAATYLVMHKLAAQGDQALGTAPWIFWRMAPTPRTRRFVQPPAIPGGSDR